MDFSGRSEKLEKEAKLRREALKQKKEKENALEAKAALRDEAAAELRLIKRETEEKLAEERDELLVADRLLTGGITFLEDHLAPYLIEGEDDKIILPESCLIELNQLDVFVGKGPVLLRLRRSCLSSETEEYTHCGIREFSAKPGTIGIPSKILHSILSRDKGNHPYTSTVDGDAGAQKAELDKRVLQLGGLSAKYVVRVKVYAP